MLRKAAKIILIIFLTVFLLLIAIIVLPWVISPIIDNIALGHYESQILEELELPPDVEVIEIIHGCGNTGGTGNHTEMYVGMLVKTSLPAEEWDEYHDQVYSTLTHGMETWAMGCTGISFSGEYIEEGYYILEFIQSAPCSEFDLRGH